MTIKVASARIDERGNEYHGLTLNVADIVKNEGFEQACLMLAKLLKENISYDN